MRGADPADPPLDNDGVGRVYGGELLVRQELWKNFFGWVVVHDLALGAARITRTIRGACSSTTRRTSSPSSAATSSPRGFQIGVRFRYVTGNPYTPVIGAYYDVNSDAYVPHPRPGLLGAARPFNQLDVRFDKTWTFHRWSLSLYLDMQNLYGASNPEGYQYNYDFTQRAPVSGLPFLPVLGIRGDF